jgi:hypothetical protein
MNKGLLMILKNLVALAMVSMLAACGGGSGGEKKVTVIDGTSKGSVQQTYTKLVRQIPNEGIQMQWEVDYKMLVHYYPEDAQLTKALGGKTLDEVKPVIAEAHAFYLKKHRELFVQEKQADIDREKAEVAKFEAMEDSNLKPLMIDQHEAKLRLYKREMVELLALTDEQFIQQYSDGASFSDYVRPGAKY